MDQEVTISPELIDYIYNNTPVYKRNEALDLIELIEQNYFTNDINDIQFSRYVEKLNNLKDEQKRNAIHDIIRMWRAKEPIPYKIEKDKFDEIELSQLSKDKIILNPNKTEKDLKKLQKNYNDVEFHNVNSFIHPKTYQRLKNLPTKIIFEKDVQYDLTIIIEPFFRHSKQLEIYDPYIYNPNAFRQLVKIIDISYDKKIELVALKRELYFKNDIKGDKKKYYDKFYEFINAMINSGYSINIKEYKSGKHKERYILTDKYQIYLPGGLDILDENNYPFLDDESDTKELRIDMRI